MEGRVLVVGAGPIGLEGAVLLVQSGFRVLLVERGPLLAASVHQWGHVHLFSPNELNCSAWGLHALSELGGEMPVSTSNPTGCEFAENYLKRLGEWLSSKPELCEIRLNTSVDAISRGNLLKKDHIKATGDNQRDSELFDVILSSHEQEERIRDIIAVLDCSGTYSNPNFLGRGGAPALGERALRAYISKDSSFDVPVSRFFHRGLPDVLGKHRPAFVYAKGGVDHVRSIALVGSGYSAATLISQLRTLASEMPEQHFQVDWIVRRREPNADLYAVIDEDPLPSRAALVNTANSLASGGSCPPNMAVRVHHGCSVDRISIEEVGRFSDCFLLSWANDCLKLTGSKQSAGGEDPLELSAGVIVSLVGFRPNLEMARELQEAAHTYGLLYAMSTQAFAHSRDASTSGPSVLRN
ncbi:MAG: hypothetical protein SGPRY_002187 [Prymnesium sp.]